MQGDFLAWRASGSGGGARLVQGVAMEITDLLDVVDARYRSIGAYALVTGVCRLPGPAANFKC